MEKIHPATVEIYLAKQVIIGIVPYWQIPVKSPTMHAQSQTVNVSSNNGFSPCMSKLLMKNDRNQTLAIRSKTNIWLEKQFIEDGKTNFENS